MRGDERREAEGTDEDETCQHADPRAKWWPGDHTPALEEELEPNVVGRDCQVITAE